MNDEVKVRLAARGEISVIVGFNLEMALETEGKSLSSEVLAAGVAGIFDRPERGFYLVAELLGEVVGSLMVTTEWSDWRNADFWWIQSVYVVPGCRGRGVFRALYEAVRGRAERAEQVCGCRLYVEKDNLSAQAVYERMGMEESPYRLFEDEFD